MTIWIDHAVYAVPDLDEAGERWNEEHGLASVPGGRHPGWGTANRIVPLGDTYLELIAVGDPAEAAASWFGRAVGEVASRGGGWFTWCAGDDDLEGTARRLGLSVESKSRERPDGSVLRWRSTGLERAVAQPSFPFFIHWDVPAHLHPGRSEAKHRERPLGIARVAVGGDTTGLDRWVGGDTSGLPLTTVDSPPGLAAVHVALVGGGEVILA